MSESEVSIAQHVLEARGTACAHLTPLMQERIRAMASGEVLEVRSDDPAARAGVPAWSRLTGHELITVVEDDATRTRFFVRRK